MLQKVFSSLKIKSIISVGNNSGCLKKEIYLITSSLQQSRGKHTS